MPLRIISADAAGRLDGTVKATILDRLAAAPDVPDATVVAVSNFPDYRFNPELRAVRGPVIVVDFMEYGANWTDMPSHLFGALVQPIMPPIVAGEEWQSLHEWLRDGHPPSLYLKRELFAKDVHARVRPIDWPAMQPAPPVQSRAEFDARPIEVFHCWGYSHPLRPKLHAAIFEAMATRGIDVLSDFRQLTGREACGVKPARTWASIYVPWYARAPMPVVMAAQQQAKISVSLPGFGLKCFRHAEAPVGAVMAMTNDPLAWSFPGTHGFDCVRIGRDTMFDDILEAARAPGLYGVYVESQKTIDRYRPDRYANEYLLPLIREALA